jgi:HD-like signal output (HDOD) protein
MLHDVGKMVIYRQFPAEYAEALEQAAAQSRRMIDYEGEFFQYFNHATIGGLVIRKWNLPDMLAEAVRFHHDLERDVPPKMINPHAACLVSLANALVNGLGYGEPNEAHADLANLACARWLKYPAERHEALAAAAAEAIEARKAAMA